MSKTAFIFPGQGAQYLGMAMDLIQTNSEFKETLINFDQENDTELLKIMSTGPEEILQETKFTQPAILFHSIIAMKYTLERIDLKPDFVAGHSLGEFSALVANGTLTLRDALYLVHKRGEYMIKANQGKPFGMAAIIGLTPDRVKDICKIASKTDIVIAANYNTPVQTVISGSKIGVDKACEIAKEEGAKRIVPLVVGGPFHSPLIKKAALWLKKEMDQINFNRPAIPVISNVDAIPVTDPEIIKHNLARQVTSSVLWVNSMNYLIKNNVTNFIEFGPKKVLAGMMKKIDRNVKVISIDTVEDFDAVKNELENI
ncbi:MAG: ACP S-malonyltransferase [Candidatus Cloacimonetes bacterium]|nr:ACP S-malonyltransferase [Candidatus Cloacimonadota bacterium]